MSNEITPFEEIRRTNPAGNEFWSSRDFAKVLGYADYRNFQSVIESARTACFNSGQRVDDHFVEVTEMVEIGSGAQRPLKAVMMSRYACYLVIQNADPSKEIVAQGFETNFIQNACENKKTANFVGSRADRKGHVAGYKKSTSMQIVMSFHAKILCSPGDFGASFKIVKNVLEVGTHFA